MWDKVLGVWKNYVNVLLGLYIREKRLGFVVVLEILKF